jgi:hypothetical protein
MTDTPVLDPTEERLRATLQTKAAQLVVLDEPFDAMFPTPIDAPRRRRAGWLVGVLAVAAAIAGALIVVGARGRGPAVATASSVPTATTAAPAPAADSITAPLLAPTWVPDGEQLWSVTSEPQVDLSQMRDQLFGTVAADGTLAPGLLVELQPAPEGSTVGAGAPVTVRGVQGVTRDSKDAGTGTYAVEWIDGHTDVRVTVRGASVADAVAAIDALRARGTDLSAGFDAAADPNGYALLGEHIGTAPDDNVAATFEYAPETAGARPDFTVLTYTDDQYPDDLRVWIAGGRAADGSTFERDPQAGYYAAWSDGREVIVRARDANVDPGVLDRIAHSVTTLDEHDAAALAAGAQARLAALPSTGTVELAAGSVSLRGNATLGTVCLTVEGFDPACADPFVEDAAGIEDGSALPGHAGSAVVDGRWYVFAAAATDAVISQAPGVRQYDLPVGRGAIGSTRVALVAVPDGVDHVNILVPTGPNGYGGGGFTRPRTR